MSFEASVVAVAFWRLQTVSGLTSVALSSATLGPFALSEAQLRRGIRDLCRARLFKLEHEGAGSALVSIPKRGRGES